jgi:hypothetical protein
MVVIDVIGSRETDKVTIRAREKERDEQMIRDKRVMEGQRRTSAHSFHYGALTGVVNRVVGIWRK